MFAMTDMRRWMTLVRLDEADEQPAVETPASRFLTELWRITAPHPFSRRQRIVNDSAVVEVRPDVDDRATTIHILDIFSLYAGERQGAGRAALILLLQLADKHGVTLTLYPKAYAKGPGSKKFPKTAALIDWYSRYGFKKRTAKFRAREMERTPNTPFPQE